MRIHNITDHPSFISSSILIRGTRIGPGESIEIKEADDKLTKTIGIIVGHLPNWYTDWKSPRVTQKQLEDVLKFKEERAKSKKTNHLCSSSLEDRLDVALSMEKIFEEKKSSKKK